MYKGVSGQSNKILLTILFMFCSGSVNAEVYKWVDENGKTVYGDKPTSGDADQIKIKKRPVQDSAVQERIKKQQKLLDVMQDEREKKYTLKEEERKKNEEQKKLCEQAKRDLKENQDANVLYTETDDPDNPRIWTDKERRDEEKKFEEYIKENC